MAAEKAVTETARDDHNCPVEHINIKKKVSGEWTYELEVCSRDRTYSYPGDDKEFDFKEVKHGHTASAAESAADEALGELEGEEGSGGESEDSGGDDSLDL